MRFPSITSYIDAVINIGDRLRTRNNIKPVFDCKGYPVYYADKSVVTFSVHINGVVAALKCFTSVKGYDRVESYNTAGIIAGEMLEYELFVFDDNHVGDYYSVFLCGTNKVVTEGSTVTYQEGLVPFQNNQLWGYKDPHGNVVINAMYDNVEEFSEGRAVVTRDLLQGLSDTQGHLILNTIYDEISWDGSAIAYCNLNGKWGCYDRSGREIAPCKYDWVGEFSHSMLLFRVQDKYGFINIMGEQVIPAVYDSATSFDENGVSSVKICGKNVMINTKGEIEL